jgi:hypothetical protein
MREAFRMNLTPSFWFKAIFSNIRAIVLIAVVVIAAGAKIVNKDSRNWQEIATLFAVAIALVALYGWRLTSSMKKTANKLNASCERITVDAQGLATASATGATSFSPWSQYHRWKEGKLVFTVGDAKAFRTIPKSAMSEMQAGEVRGILQSQIR